ncbi:excinuclease ABC subunit UvrB [endosymbiont GvMRE of Glomus versiforme]|uniref:excinuclease ABC subunit UvrB n=1 Tax=endosymbiont GvMRE of Glomus versiforme TaxID=2039283 RepID=UPI000EBA3180|nr:excinuclease ABC subunit UvrB [endosymbiont GvMRE of Glomus versiforme]RHZ36824.1 UvrABC system protein B [endosymbiont GvMRE of Glomus versiforme]
MFRLITNLNPQGDQEKAIQQLVENIQQGKKQQVLLGATGTGKTFTMANVIAQTQKSTLILAPNKTLALQIYQEMQNFFPQNKVEYYVSYFDYYQPEAYKPHSDTYISKRTQVNVNIQRMRLRTLNSLVTEKNVIVIASVAAIYGCFDPNSYRKAVLELRQGQKISKKEIATWLTKLGYNPHAIELEEGCFFVKENSIILKIVWEENHYWQLEIKNDILEKIERHSLTKDKKTETKTNILIPPTREYIYLTEEESKSMTEILAEIKQELKKQAGKFHQEGKIVEARRLEEKISEDLINLGETGYCPMIENYARYFDGRKPGECPYALLDYFEKDYLTIVDESHLAVPQIKAMYNTDHSRKKTLVQYGFRLPSALDNRPLNFTEFKSKLSFIVYTSATPGPYEREQTNQQVVEQIIRPTGLLDPLVEVRPTKNQIEDIIKLIQYQVIKKEKTIIYALTIKMAEDIAYFLNQRDIKAIFLHSKLDIFARNQAITSLRRGVYDVIVGINLLREGLDMPEVSLICILDADKPGFLRDTRSLIQIIGRVARHQNGRVILYGDAITTNMREAMAETQRRRNIQEAHNRKNQITPQTIQKEIFFLDPRLTALRKEKKEQNWSEKKLSKEIRSLQRKMKKAAQEFDFDKAAEYRDLILDLQKGATNKD